MEGAILLNGQPVAKTKDLETAEKLGKLCRMGETVKMIRENESEFIDSVIQLFTHICCAECICPELMRKDLITRDQVKKKFVELGILSDK